MQRKHLSLQGSYDRARQKLQLAVVTSDLAMEAEGETQKKFKRALVAQLVILSWLKE